VLIGGVGGTYGTFLSALHKGLPRFPLGGTGGDAAQAFQHMCELWDVMPNPGIAKSQFETLGRPVANPEDARTLANELVPLVINSVLHRNGRKPKSIFVSYSRSDEEWMRRVVATLQPIEQSGRATIWTDIHIEAGSQWDVELRRSLSTCDVAVLLVSPSFIQSGYVQDVELPVLVERAKAKRTKVLWVALSESAWETTELRNTQAVLNPRQPLDRRSSAEVQVALVKLRQTVDKSIAGMDR
jgi:hypothetical protein